MSRVGQSVIKLPASIGVEITERAVKISKKGDLAKAVSRSIPDGLRCELGDGFLRLYPANDLKSVKSSRAVGFIKAQWGLFAKLLSNCVYGLDSGFVVILDITGVGNKAFISADGRILTLALGYSHDIVVAVPDGVTVKCEKNVTLELRGHDNVVLGDFAAKLSSFRVPDPYKLKGIIRRGKKIRKKEGKAG